ncbi:MAG: N-6 DNA methylase [Anaeromicrobium sp.]|jgi:adenine-specific DNA-methyltransferase|uniref:Eco57I restriction-modification methylase domain-containing protein n=1 Tax=Anaeromicrobium sp. TaxID=1929132 RepID=UPI0025F2562A|nr:N-6 DNA methylase [Anaeromicrobium sp.]MCT4593350.1 N-6 DNA methylase [Anaeromicrobium sp.]
MGNRVEELIEELMEVNNNFYGNISVMDVFFKIFIKKYGKGALVNIEPNIKEKEMLLKDEVLNMEITSFSRLYENYISLFNKHKTGSFYTPEYILKYMIRESLIKYVSLNIKLDINVVEKILEKKETNLVDETVLKSILSSLDNIKIIDVACGTGLFLIEAYKSIYKYKVILYKALNMKIDPGVKAYILEENIYGIDIQRDPVLVCRMCLTSLGWTGEELNIKENIIRGNSLIEETYNRPKIKKILEEGGFHIVIGNPPYLGEKGNKDIFRRIRETSFGREFYESKMDYFYYFIYKGIHMLNKDGILTFITTSYFSTADGAMKLRSFLKENVSFFHILNLNDYEIFKNAKGQHNLIYFMKRGRSKEKIKLTCIRDKNIDIVKYLKRKGNNKYTEEFILENQGKLYGENNHIFIQGHVAGDSILDKLEKNKDCNLGEKFNINQGIVTGLDKVTKGVLNNKFTKEEIVSKNIKLGEGVFVITKEEMKKLGLEKNIHIKKLYKNSNIGRYVTKGESGKYIFYFNGYLEDDRFYDKEVKKHLCRFKIALEKRREVINGTKPWYSIQWPRREDLFLHEKILVPQRAKKNTFAFEGLPWYASADVYYITKKSSLINWKFILGQLNSKLIYYWLYYLGKRKGQYLELYSTPLKNVPIKTSWRGHEEISNLVGKIIQGGSEEEYQRFIDERIYEMYGLNDDEIRRVERVYNENCIASIV